MQELRSWQIGIECNKPCPDLIGFTIGKAYAQIIDLGSFKVVSLESPTPNLVQRGISVNRPVLDCVYYYLSIRGISRACEELGQPRMKMEWST